jgi:hypothetical protein
MIKMEYFKIIIFTVLICSCSFKKIARQGISINPNDSNGLPPLPTLATVLPPLCVCCPMTRCLPPIIETKSSSPPIIQSSVVPIYYPQFNSATSSTIHGIVLLTVTIFTINLYL